MILKYPPIANFNYAAITGGAAFGPRIHPVTGQWKHHDGIDVSVSKGTPIYDVQDGVVEVSKVQEGDVGFGSYILIRHKDGYSVYAHLSERRVKRGQVVKAGQIIALSGGVAGEPGSGTSTGPHLHFGLCKDFYASKRGWIDPQPILIDMATPAEVEEMRYDYVSEVPEWGKPTVIKLMRQGIIANPDGELNLSEDMVRIMVYTDRAGLYDR